MTFEAWVGRTATTTDVAADGPVALLAAALDRPIPPPGEAMPPLAHWLFFPDWPSRSDLGDDGHLRRGELIPPLPHRRRMRAGGEVEFHRPLRAGSRMTKTETVAAVEEKDGRSGPLAFVTVDVAVGDEDGPLISERVDLVYVDAPPGGVAAGAPAPMAAAWRASLRTDEALLFRFSALTYNTHRIHYDHGYATGVEGYPGLVVHGPLIATGLVLLADDHGARPRRFEYRSVAPVYCPDEVTFLGKPRPGGAELAAMRADGTVVMEAAVTV